MNPDDSMNVMSQMEDKDTNGIRHLKDKDTDVHLSPEG